MAQFFFGLLQSRLMPFLSSSAVVGWLVYLVSPDCSIPLLPCESCANMTTPWANRILPRHYHQAMTSTTPPTAHATSNGLTNSNSYYSMSQCSHCQFISPLPSTSIDAHDLRTFLRFKSIFPWTRSRMWNYQLQLDEESFISECTKTYLQRLNEFRVVSSQQANSDQAQRRAPEDVASSQTSRSNEDVVLDGGQGIEEDHERKSQESFPSNSRSPNKSQPYLTTAAAAAVEQRLLRAREELLQVTAMSEEMKHNAKIAVADDIEEYIAHRSTRRNQFNETHLKIIRFLLSPPASLPMDPTLSSTFDDFCTFLQSRTSLLRSKMDLHDAWSLYQHGVLLHSRHAQSATDSPSTKDSSHSALVSHSTKILLNMFQLRFHEQHLIMKLKVEPFRRLNATINQLLLQLYDHANILMISHHPNHPSVVSSTDALDSTLNDPNSTPALTLAYLDDVPPIYRQAAAEHWNLFTRYEGMENESNKFQHLNYTDLVMCIEQLRLLYADIYDMIKLPSYDLFSTDPPCQSVSSSPPLPSPSRSSSSYPHATRPIAALHPSTSHTTREIDSSQQRQSSHMPSSSAPQPPSPSPALSSSHLRAPSSRLGSSRHRRPHPYQRSQHRVS